MNTDECILFSRILEVSSPIQSPVQSPIQRAHAALNKLLLTGLEKNRCNVQKSTIHL